jgi:hypothetical protein|tara:strand:+ start:342 stop:563 length:222 start_codon:yes stop_codon:yes gene_type:complete
MKILNIQSSKTHNEANGRFIHVWLFNTKVLTVKAVVREAKNYWNSYNTPYYKVFNLGKIYLGFTRNNKAISNS